MVQSLAAQSLKAGTSLEEARQTFDRRIKALGRAHQLLSRQKWEGADLGEVARAVVEVGGDPARFAVAGPLVRLTPQMALALSMALFELTTNAVKYGALSNATGTVEIVWQVTDEAEAPRLQIVWRERGGPPVTSPTRRGFGTRMIEDNLAHALGGEVHLAFEPGGLSCTINAALPVVDEPRTKDSGPGAK
jgi:two-component sensor histidine kinase